MKDKRKIFFTGLLTVLLVLANIVAIKMTVIAKLPLSCSILVYPFTFLCIAVITELYGAKDAMKSILFAIVVQIIIYALATLVVNMPNQVTTLDKANALQLILAPDTFNGMYVPNIKIALASLFGFGVSQLINVGLYNFSKKYTYRPIACALSVLIAIIIDAVIYVPISNMGLAGNEMTLKLINQFVAGVVATLIIVILFAIFTIRIKKQEKKKEVEPVKKTEKKTTTKAKKAE